MFSIFLRLTVARCAIGIGDIMEPQQGNGKLLLRGDLCGVQRKRPMRQRGHRVSV